MSRTIEATYERAPEDVNGVRCRRSHRRRTGNTALHVAFWFVIASTVVLWLDYGGPARVTDLASALRAAGIMTGLVGTTLVFAMVFLAARIPWIDRTIGHDTAIAHHRRLGKPALYLILTHAALLTVARAAEDGVDVVAATKTLLTDFDQSVAYIALGLFVVIVVSSIIAAVRRWSYEAWFVIHLLSYLAILLGMPHQSKPGRIFDATSPRYAYWLALLVVAFGALLVFRFIVPLVRNARHRVHVERVEQIAPSVVSIHLTGRNLDRLRTAGGQYATWRFFTRATWWHAHPISFSAVPTATSARITVRSLGKGSTRISCVRSGTRVMVTGPYGIFTDAARAAPRLAVVAAGVGVTPVRSMLEDSPLRPGEATVLLRGSDGDQRYLWDEIGDLAASSGSSVVKMEGRRPPGVDTWMSAEAVAGGATITTLFPALLDSDLYVCGPPAWTDLVIRDARAAGLPQAQVHAERFDW